MFGEILGAIGGVIKGATGLIGGAIKGVTGLVGGIFGGGAKTSVLYGPVAAKTSSTGLDLLGGISNIFGGAVEAVGQTVGVLGDLPEAASKTIDSLANITSKSMEIYRAIVPQKTKVATAAAPTALPTTVQYPTAPASIQDLLASILSGQQPAATIMTTPASTTMAAPNYLLYAIIAVVVIILLRKK